VFRIAQRVVVFFVVGASAIAALVATSDSGWKGSQTGTTLPSSPARVVVAELFTSEGCSSCPPADALLMRLAREPFVPGVRVLALSEHVDYWDRLGWRDPFSSPAFSHRQSEYDASVFHNGSVYTPQLVIDGRFQEVGSDANAARRAIARAAQAAKAEVVVTARPDDAGHVAVEVQVSATPRAVMGERAEVIVALTEDQLTSDVQRGENRGRLLKHIAVVRSLTALGSFAPLHTFSGRTSIPTSSSWATRNLSVVAFVQERQSRQISGAGSVSVAQRANGS
jgi:hypothetical protein